MQIIREFHHEFIEVSHVKIGIQLHMLWYLEVQFWVQYGKPLEIPKNRTWKWVKIVTLF